jgi:hypothetical protein
MATEEGWAVDLFTTVCLTLRLSGGRTVTLRDGFMALRPAYLLMNVEFDDFLFAPVGEQSNGMPLSVISALASLDLDPWDKAAQLAGLTVKDAVQTLALLIARLPVGRWELKDASTIAARLVSLLPKRASPGHRQGTAHRPSGQIGFPAIAWLIALMLLGVGLFGIVRSAGSVRGDNSASGAASHVAAPAPTDQ